MDEGQYIYLDYAATTPIDQRVLEEMMPYFTNTFANASSNHALGVIASQGIKTARAQVANLIGSEPNEIIFTSGATESINLALKGLLEQYSDQKQHIVTVTTEHPAVLNTCKYLESKGYEITYLPVNTDGLIDIELLADAVRVDTLVVCVMLANNETGVIQPINEIADIAY